MDSTRQELLEFHRFVSDKIQREDAALTPEDLLEEWRSIHPLSEEVDGDIAAVEEVLADMENGDRGVPLEDFEKEFRARHSLRPRP